MKLWPQAGLLRLLIDPLRRPTRLNEDRNWQDFAFSFSLGAENHALTRI